MTVWVAIKCPPCHSTELTKYGKLPLGKQRYRCQNKNCPYRTFVFTPTYPRRTREVKQQIVEMTKAELDSQDMTPYSIPSFKLS